MIGGMDTSKVRVRFAPSSAGPLYVSNARTALYNWLFARRMGGDFVVRFEDADLERPDPQAESALLRDLRWLGLEWDEGPGDPLEKGEKARPKGPNAPYRQSERHTVYEKVAHRLLEEGKAYRCFCTEQELEAERNAAASKGLTPAYSGKCRKLTTKAVRKLQDARKPYAIRLSLGEPLQSFRDLFRGKIDCAAAATGDPILIESSTSEQPGKPVYHYMVVVDDALMGITHVILGEEHLASTPQQIAIFEACGWKAPQYAHLGPVLGSDGEPLAKRPASTAIANFHEKGYLPESMTNALGLLGWSSETGKQTFTLADLLRNFALERVSAEPVAFDFEKLNSLNRYWIRSSSPVRLAALSWEYLGGLLPEKDDARDDVLIWFVNLVQVFSQSIDRLDQLTAKALFVFGFDPREAVRRADNVKILAEPRAGKVLQELDRRLRRHFGEVRAEDFAQWLVEIGKELEIGASEVEEPARIALTGSATGPDLDKLVPLIEQGGMLGLGVPSVRQRVERIMGM